VVGCELVVTPNQQSDPDAVEELKNTYGLDDETFNRKLEIRRKAKGNGGRTRENWEEIAPELCKDATGEWTKFVPERLSPEELQAFERLNELCKTDPLTDWLSANHKIRYLRGWGWNPEVTFTNLIACEELRASNNSDKISYEDISVCINW
jgi:hypothetical protein